MTDKRKHDSEKQRLESMKRKRQEFKEKQNIIKSGLIAIDKVPNKKILFVDDDGSKSKATLNGDKAIVPKKPSLFDGDESDDDVNFEVKEHFEGKKGQKVLDLQSRYKSDKRFVLDQRFLDDQSDEEKKDTQDDNEEVDLTTTDEKTKQLHILQGVLGVSLKTNMADTGHNKKAKTKLGMLRFDPMQPDHVKFLAPVEETNQEVKKKKKRSKEKREENTPLQVSIAEPELKTVEVSKEQFYKVSDTLKETIDQPNTFSLRSLFGTNDKKDEEAQNQQPEYIPLEETKKKPKVLNPLDPGEKNPFVYDSSDSEPEDIEDKNEANKEIIIEKTEIKAVWKENLFFCDSDKRLADGLAFFNETIANDRQKERRNLKSLMKKRIHNKERKNHMFHKKIGGRKKSMKRNFVKKNF